MALKQLLHNRLRLRKQGEFLEADQIRDMLSEVDFIVVDTKNGITGFTKRKFENRNNNS